MSSFGLKLTALILMLLDHIYQFLHFTGEIPLFFTWLGRLSAPLFFFCMVQGMIYTHDRKKYLLRMYLFAVAMAAGNFALQTLFPVAPADIHNNIFTTMLLGGIIIVCMDEMAKDRQKGQLLWMYFIGIELAAFFIGDTLTRAGQTLPAQILEMLIPTPFTAEGGIWWVMMAPLLYYFRFSKRNLSIAYVVLSLIISLPGGIQLYTMGYSVWESFFRYGFQWMMLFSLPMMLLYNGKKGKISLKYLFYLFYPLHIWGLYLLGVFLCA